MARFTIYVTDELKSSMRDQKVNWSRVASEAFERQLAAKPAEAVEAWPSIVCALFEQVRPVMTCDPA